MLASNRNEIIFKFSESDCSLPLRQSDNKNRAFGSSTQSHNVVPTEKQNIYHWKPWSPQEVEKVVSVVQQNIGDWEPWRNEESHR